MISGGEKERKETVDLVGVGIQVSVELAIGDVHADLTRVVFQKEHVLLHLRTFDVQFFHRVRLLLQKGEEAGTVVTNGS